MQPGWSVLMIVLRVLRVYALFPCQPGDGGGAEGKKEKACGKTEDN